MFASVPDPNPCRRHERETIHCNSTKLRGMDSTLPHLKDSRVRLLDLYWTPFALAGAPLISLAGNGFKSFEIGITSSYETTRTSIYGPSGRKGIASSGYISTRPATILAPYSVFEVWKPPATSLRAMSV